MRATLHLYSDHMKGIATFKEICFSYLLDEIWTLIMGKQLASCSLKTGIKGSTNTTILNTLYLVCEIHRTETCGFT